MKEQDSRVKFVREHLLQLPFPIRKGIALLFRAAFLVTRREMYYDPQLHHRLLGSRQRLDQQKGDRS